MTDINYLELAEKLAKEQAEKLKKPDTCECRNCKGEDHACHFDCDPGEQCEGCAELAQERADMQFEYERERGMF